MMHLELLGTSGCHLCEQAEELLAPLVNSTGVVLQIIDIAEDKDAAQLLLRYGLRIPVLRCAERELDWPFDELAVARFLQTGSARR